MFCCYCSSLSILFLWAMTDVCQALLGWSLFFNVIHTWQIVVENAHQKKTCALVRLSFVLKICTSFKDRLLTHLSGPMWSFEKKNLIQRPRLYVELEVPHNLLHKPFSANKPRPWVRYRTLPYYCLPFPCRPSNHGARGLWPVCKCHLNWEWSG